MARNCPNPSRSSVSATILAWYTSWLQLAKMSPKNLSTRPIVLCNRLFSVRSSSIYAQARSVLLSFKPALLGFHKLPHPWLNGGFALWPTDPKLLSAVDVCVESLFHCPIIAQQSRPASVDPIASVYSVYSVYSRLPHPTPAEPRFCSPPETLRERA